MTSLETPGEIEGPTDGSAVPTMALGTADGAGPVAFVEPQPARKVASTATPSNPWSVALERRIIDYPNLREGRRSSIGHGCGGFAEHGLRPAHVSNGAGDPVFVESRHRLQFWTLCRVLLSSGQLLVPHGLISNNQWEQWNGPSETGTRTGVLPSRRQDRRRLH